jgi:DNA-binding transcriptional ArsR family regulator
MNERSRLAGRPLDDDHATQRVSEEEVSVSSRGNGVASDISFPPPIASKRLAETKEGGSGELPFAPLAPLLENVPQEPEWILRGYLAPFAITLLAGRPKVGKSTLVFALLADVTTGEPFVGLGTSRNGVLLLTEERRDTLAEKARVLGLIGFRHGGSPIGGENESAAVHALMRHDAGDASWPEIVRQAMAHCAQHDLGTLVVDTFDRWTGLKGDAENTAGAVNEAIAPLGYAAAAGLAVLVVSHQRKSTGEFGDAVRGSTALTGGVDIVVELERPPRASGLGSHARVLRAVSRFSSTPDELYLALEDDGFAAIENPEQMQADADRERVLKALEEVGEPTSPQVIAEALELTQPTIRRHLNTLRDRGAVTRTGTGKKGDPYQWEPVSTGAVGERP